MKIVVRKRRIVARRRRGFNNIRWIPKYSGPMPIVRSLSQFSKWLSDKFGSGVYSVLGHDGKFFSLFYGSVDDYAYEFDHGSIERFLPVIETKNI